MDDELSGGPTVTVRPLGPGDRAAWQPLYEGYGEFYATPLTPEKADRVWGWLMDPNYEAFGLIALDDSGRAVGIAHYRQFARLLGDGFGIYLDDLFTSGDARGGGVASALIRALETIARERGAAIVRWITAADNTTAQRLYDRVATKTSWLTYDLTVTSEGAS